MIGFLTASLIRPVVVAAAAWLLLRIYKVRHPASRHAVWTAVLIAMMVLPLITVFAPQWKLPLLPKKPETVAQTQVQQPEIVTEAEFSDARPQTPPSQSAKFAWPTTQTLIVWCYFAGVLAMIIFRLTGWALLWRVMSKSRLLRTRLRESSEVITPVTVGVLRPSVILPAGWRNWNANTKRAVLAHEFAHIRRRDTLTSSLTRLAKCIYWFHPLAWWISRQMSELAELSCDAAALEKNGDPGSYSRILLGFAETVQAAGYRAALPGLAIASRSGVGHRIDQVFELAGGNLRRLSRPGTVLALMGLPVMCIAAVVGLIAPASRVLHQSPQPLVIAQLHQPTTSPSQSTQLAPASKPEFEAASIKPCSPGDGVGGRSGGPQHRGVSTSPGRLNISCMSLSELINSYIGGLGEQDNSVNSGGPSDTNPIRGGPAWVYSDPYTIEAQTDDPVANESTDHGATPATRLMRGPMLHALLEDRFQLRTHRETEDVPMYALTVAKGGLKLKPMEEGSCHPPDPLHPPQMGPPPDGKPWCIGGLSWPGPNWVINQTGQGLVSLAAVLSDVLDRHVIDGTGISSLFSYHLEFGPDENAPCFPVGSQMACPAGATTNNPAGPSIFTVVEQQLGLKLEPIKGPRGYIAIDHVERPSEN
jgi:uncharacterized protein (TIGR03435 family)